MSGGYKNTWNLRARYTRTSVVGDKIVRTFGLQPAVFGDTVLGSSAWYFASRDDAEEEVRLLKLRYEEEQRRGVA